MRSTFHSASYVYCVSCLFVILKIVLSSYSVSRPLVWLLSRDVNGCLSVCLSLCVWAWLTVVLQTTTVMPSWPSRPVLYDGSQTRTTSLTLCRLSSWTHRQTNTPVTHSTTYNVHHGTVTQCHVSGFLPKRTSSRLQLLPTDGSTEINNIPANIYFTVQCITSQDDDVQSGRHFNASQQAPGPGWSDLEGHSTGPHGGLDSWTIRSLDRRPTDLVLSSTSTKLARPTNQCVYRNSQAC